MNLCLELVSRKDISLNKALYEVFFLIDANSLDLS